MPSDSSHHILHRSIHPTENSVYITNIQGVIVYGIVIRSNIKGVKQRLISVNYCRIGGCFVPERDTFLILMTNTAPFPWLTCTSLSVTSQNVYGTYACEDFADISFNHILSWSLRWRHNEWDGFSNHQPHHCLLNRLSGRRSKKTSKPHVTGLCAGNSPGPVNSPHKWPVTRKRFPFDDVIMVPHAKEAASNRAMSKWNG